MTYNGALPVSTSRYGYDPLNRLDAMSHRRGLQDDGFLLSGYDYRVRADGKRKGYDETIANDQTAATPRVIKRTVEFKYDDAGRLIKEESRDGEGVAYQLDWALDKVGNRTLETRLKAKDAMATDWTGGSLTRIQSSYSSTGTDWLTLTTSTRGTPNAGATSFVGATTATQSGYNYDFNGSQTRKTTQAAEGANTSEGMEWSFEGALLRVEKGENNATRFTYDAAGNRIQTVTRDGAKLATANYLVDENTAYAQVLEERDASNVLQARYVYGQGYGPILLQRRQKNGAGAEEVRTRYLLADGHGSVRQLINESGVVTDSYFYDAWGGGLSGGSGNTINPYRYNGQQTDEATGGYYLRARYYQPGQGRFLGHDPLLGNNSDPVSLHRYLYAGGDGVNGIDPSGEVTIIETLAVISITATLVVLPGCRSNPTSTTKPFTTKEQLIVDKLKSKIFASNPEMKQICSSLDNIKGVANSTTSAGDGIEVAAETLPVGAPGNTTGKPEITLSPLFFTEPEIANYEITQCEILIHEALHGFTDKAADKLLDAPNQDDPGGIHRRIYGWSRTFANEIYGKNRIGFPSSGSPYDPPAGKCVVPNDFYNVIVNNKIPNPRVRYDGGFFGMGSFDLDEDWYPKD